MFNLRCWVQGHDLREVEYRNPFVTYCPPTTAIGVFTGRPETKPCIHFGFLHYGRYSKCHRCGAEVEDERKLKGLPVVEPVLIPQTSNGYLAARGIVSPDKGYVKLNSERGGYETVD